MFQCASEKAVCVEREETTQRPPFRPPCLKWNDPWSQLEEAKKAEAPVKVFRFKNYKYFNKQLVKRLSRYQASGQSCDLASSEEYNQAIPVTAKLYA